MKVHAIPSPNLAFAVQVGGWAAGCSREPRAAPASPPSAAVARILVCRSRLLYASTCIHLLANKYTLRVLNAGHRPAALRGGASRGPRAGLPGTADHYRNQQLLIVFLCEGVLLVKFIERSSLLQSLSILNVRSYSS